MFSIPVSSKTVRLILVSLLLITLINILAAFQRSTLSSWFPSSRHIINKFTDLRLALSSQESVLRDEEGEIYSLVGYHHDFDSNLVVVQKQYLLEKTPNEDTTEHFWNFLQSNFETKSEYDLNLIDGYNYKKLIKHLNEQNELQLSHSFVEQYKMENQFIQSFQNFFVQLIDTIEDCKPDLDPINNDNHYPNGDKIVKYYELRNKIPLENMKQFNIERLIHRNGRIPIYGGHLREQYKDELIRNKEFLSMYLTLSDSEISALKKSHTKFLETMMENWPENLFKFNKFNNFMKGDGIVYLGGGKYNQLVLLSIKILRENGSRLPVEVIIPYKNDYDIQFCDRVLPTLNGKCKLMTDYLPQTFVDKISGFQLKNIALLISSFERILYLDADNIPIRNPDVLFTNAPFTTKHLVVWPDLWRRSTSPHYYTIAGIEVDSNFKVRNSYVDGDERGKYTDSMYYSYHDCKGSIPEASSETGQLLINKKIHFQTLILAMYYNYYGPDYYYPLFSQGAAGEGDKETFIAAAHKLDLPYYQVGEFNREFGPINDNTRKHEFYGMGQYDPIIDYYMSTITTTQKDTKKKINYNSPLPEKYAANDEDDTCSNYDFHLFQSSSLFFLHANWLKYYIEKLFLYSYDADRGPVTNDGDKRRLYGNELKKELGGYDFELNIMKNLHWCFCEEPLIDLIGIPVVGSKTRTDVCIAIKNHIEFLEIS